MKGTFLYFFCFLQVLFASELPSVFQSPFQAPLYSLELKKEYSSAKDSEKIVLYMNGNETDVWFYLGALYAFESYGVPVDSIVSTSYAAFLGSLWKSGYSIDSIQYFLRSEKVFPFFNPQKHKSKPQNYFALPVSASRFASIKTRYFLEADSLGLRLQNIPIELDSLFLDTLLFQLHLENALYRNTLKTSVSVVLCNGNLSQKKEDVLASLPFSENISGTGCALALPASDANEVSVLLSATPVRKPERLTPEEEVAYLYMSKALSNADKKTLIIRPHSIRENSPEALIQAGFSAVEQKLSVLAKHIRLKPYETVSRLEKPWYRFSLITDSLDGEKASHLKTFWNEADTNFQAVENFLNKMAENPLYDSLSLHLTEEGSLIVNGKSHPVLDLEAGGFGSVVTGPLAALQAKLFYINQFEYELGVLGFYGENAFGISPVFKLNKLLSGAFSVLFRYDFTRTKPRNDFLTEENYRLKIREETKKELLFSLDYNYDRNYFISLSTIIGKNEYEMDKRLSDKKIEVKKITPQFHVEYKTRESVSWFDTSGISLGGLLGLEALGASFGEGESVPIFYKLHLSGKVNFSLTDFLIFGTGADYGANIYREDGEDYPVSFGFEPIDLTVRRGINATPFSSEWYFKEFRSHEYFLLKAHLGLHYSFFSAWLFSAYVFDRENYYTSLNQSRISLEAAVRWAYKSLSVYTGMHRTMNINAMSDWNDFKNHYYFIKVGNYF